MHHPEGYEQAIDILQISLHKDGIQNKIYKTKKNAHSCKEKIHWPETWMTSKLVNHQPQQPVAAGTW